MSKAPSRWEQLLPRFSLGRPITVLMILATALVVGTIATVGIPLETFPQGFESPFLSVAVPWPDAPPQEVLEKIILPMEEELSTVRGIERLSSLANSSSGLLFLTFKQGTDMDIAYREVRDRTQRVRPALPDDADRVFIQKHDLSGFPVFFIGMAVDPELTDSYNLIQTEIVRRLERIDGVANIEANGLEEKEILIELDRERTTAAGLNIYQLAEELSGDNFTLASGRVRDGNSEMLLRSVARYEDLETLRRRRVSESVLLGDVATISYEEPEKEYSARVDSKPAVALAVFKEGQANTLELCRRIKAEVEGMQDNPRLAQIEIVPIFNQGDLILDSLFTLFESGRLGAIFAVTVLFFFLRRFRMTLIITLSIPLSLIIALTAMYFFGESLNMLTLLGLMICVGLLVDNSVVVAENIHRLFRQGLGRREAVVQGAGEIALAIVTATLTTIAVFLPVSLVRGQAQFFLQRLSIPISVALAASLLVALVFVPLSVYLTLHRNGDKEPTRFQRWHQRLNRLLRGVYEATLGRVNRSYGRFLGTLLARRLDLMLAMTVIFALTWGLAFAEIDFANGQEDEQVGLEISVDLPRDNTFEDTQEYFFGVEEVMEARKEDWDLQGYLIFHNVTGGEIQAWLRTPRTTETSARQISEEMMESIPEKPGVTLFTGEESRTSECDGEFVYCVRLYADDVTLLGEAATDLETRLRQVPGVVGIKKNSTDAPSELALVLDRDRAQQQGINPQTVAGVVSYALRGESLPKYYRDGQEIPVRVRFQEGNRESLAELKTFQVPTEEGALVALGAVTDVEYQPAPKSIFRRDKRVARTVSLELAEGTEKETKREVRSLLRRVDLPEGVTLGRIQAPTVNDDVVGLLLAAGLSIAFIYLLMAFLFESFVLPMSIILTIPLASIGVGWAHRLLGLNLDFLGAIGGILLIGVVVNNGIVLIDYVNRLRAAGEERARAVLLAAERRFRPIMMTALTTICGALPLALGGATETGLSYTSFGVTLIGGMVTSTLLTLLVVPVCYTLFDDLRRLSREGVRQVLDEEAVPVAEPAEGFR